LAFGEGVVGQPAVVAEGGRLAEEALVQEVVEVGADGPAAVDDEAAAGAEDGPHPAVGDAFAEEGVDVSHVDEPGEEVDRSVVGEDEAGHAVDAAPDERRAQFSDRGLGQHGVGVDAQVQVGVPVLAEAFGEAVSFAAVLGEADEEELDAGLVEVGAQLADDGGRGVDVTGVVIDDSDRLREPGLRKERTQAAGEHRRVLVPGGDHRVNGVTGRASALPFGGCRAASSGGEQELDGEQGADREPVPVELVHEEWSCPGSRRWPARAVGDGNPGPAGLWG
jgi:hypothetical protein